MNIFKKILVVGEEKTFLELLEIIELAKKANSSLSKMLSAGNNSLLDLNEDIRLMEKQGDRISLRVKEAFTNGAVSPNVLGNLLECVDISDGILDDYYFVSRELRRMDNVKSNDCRTSQFPEMNAVLSKMLELADQALEVLIRILKATSSNEIDELRNNIELLEEEGDNIKDNGFDRLYALAPTIHFLLFSHYSELLHKFDDILDSCEDLSDLVVAITTSISK